jgi:hypothetical protein
MSWSYLFVKKPTSSSWKYFPKSILKWIFLFALLIRFVSFQTKISFFFHLIFTREWNHRKIYILSVVIHKRVEESFSRISIHKNFSWAIFNWNFWRIAFFYSFI